MAPKPRTGKPVGRPKGSVTKLKLDLRDAALPYAQLALKTLAEVCRRGDTDSARVAAANALLDRGYGKPVQSHKLGGMDGGPIRLVSTTMSEAEAAAAYAATLND